MGAANLSLQKQYPQPAATGRGNRLNGEILPSHGATPVQPSYHEGSHNTNQKHQAPPIPGGSYSIPPLALIMAWAAYRQSKLDWLALRVWIALWEIRCWHEARSNPNDTPHYHTSQITSAIKSQNLTTKRLETALSTLEQFNLVSFTSTTIWIATSLDDLQDPALRQLAEEMLSHIGHANVDRGLRIPRRMFVFLMTSQRPKPVYASVMIALLIRTMLTKRYDTYKGCCTASWIALVFGGDPSSIKSARAKLIADGWFARLETPQRVRQRYGEWVVLVIEQPIENPDETEPPTSRKFDETEPPLRNQSLSDEIETNQSLQPGAFATCMGTHPTPRPAHPKTPRAALPRRASCRRHSSNRRPQAHLFRRHRSCHPSGNTQHLRPPASTHRDTCLLPVHFPTRRRPGIPLAPNPTPPT